VHWHHFRRAHLHRFGALCNIADGFGTLGRKYAARAGYFNATFDHEVHSSPKWEKAKLGLGRSFYNVFNLPNYDLPIAT